MTIVHYEPWRLFNRFHRDIGPALGEGSTAAEASNSADVTWLPVVDVHEEAERFVVRADLPGVDPKDVEITAEKGVLTIRGQRHAEKRDSATGYERVERVSGAFLRRFTLPESAETAAIKAKQSNGVLEVTIPKSPQVQPQRIAVEAA
ncbi:MAG TPA: Hsp20/alpha crystallin family protein [Steroidobacteraceae bacterium]